MPAEPHLRISPWRQTSEAETLVRPATNISLLQFSFPSPGKGPCTLSQSCCKVTAEAAVWLTPVWGVDSLKSLLNVRQHKENQFQEQRWGYPCLLPPSNLETEPLPVNVEGNFSVTFKMTIFSSQKYWSIVILSVISDEKMLSSLLSLCNIFILGKWFLFQSLFKALKCHLSVYCMKILCVFF